MVGAVTEFLGEDVVQPETACHERVGKVVGSGVEVTYEDDRVSPSRLLNKLKNLKQLALFERFSTGLEWWRENEVLSLSPPSLSLSLSLPLSFSPSLT